MGEQQQIQHDAVEALSQLSLHNEHDVIHDQEVTLSLSQIPIAKPSQRLTEIIQGWKPAKKSTKCIYYARVANIQYMTPTSIKDALDGPSAGKWKSAI